MTERLIVQRRGIPGPEGPKGDQGDVGLANDNEWTGAQVFVGDAPFYDLRGAATGGSGLSGDPWTGWDSAFGTERKIHVSRGHYLKASASIDISTPMVVEGSPGDLREGSIIQNASDTDFFRILNGAQGFYMRGVGGQKTGAAPAAGRFVYLDSGLTSDNGIGTIPITLKELTAYNLWDGIIGDGGNQVIVEGFMTAGIQNDGIRGGSGLIDLFLSRIRIMGAGRDAFRFDGTGGLYLNDLVGFGPTGRGMHILGNTRHIFAKHVIIDLPTGNAYEFRGTAHQMTFSDCWAAGSDVYGLYIDQLAGGGGVKWSGGFIRANDLSGVSLGGSGADYSFGGGVKLGSNGIAESSGDQAGLLVAAGMSNWSIDDAFVGEIPGDSNQQQIGVHVQAGASDHYRVAGIRYRNIATPVLDEGTGLDKWVEHGPAGPQWTTPALNSPWVVPAGNQAPRYAKFGRYVVIEPGLLQNSSGSDTSATAWTMPTGYRPGNTVWNQSFASAFAVNDSGAVIPAAPVAASGYMGVGTSYRAEA